MVEYEDGVIYGASRGVFVRLQETAVWLGDGLTDMVAEPAPTVRHRLALK